MGGLSTADLISIHAPAKGATDSPLVDLSLAMDFNPRSREGSDPETGASSGSDTNFNPRSREGSDVSERTAYYRVKISIHAPAKGATTLDVRDH